MQTEKLYEQDATLRAFEATVLACEPHGARFRVALDRTAFFPEGGGQPADQGTLGEAHVLDAHAGTASSGTRSTVRCSPARACRAWWTTRGAWTSRSSTAASTSYRASCTSSTAMTMSAFTSAPGR